MKEGRKDHKSWFAYIYLMWNILNVIARDPETVFEIWDTTTGGKNWKVCDLQQYAEDLVDFCLTRLIQFLGHVGERWVGLTAVES